MLNYLKGTLNKIYVVNNSSMQHIVCKITGVNQPYPLGIYSHIHLEQVFRLIEFTRMVQKNGALISKPENTLTKSMTILFATFLGNLYSDHGEMVKLSLSEAVKSVMMQFHTDIRLEVTIQPLANWNSGYWGRPFANSFEISGSGLKLDSSSLRLAEDGATTPKLVSD